jgi:hypothetical protein
VRSRFWSAHFGRTGKFRDEFEYFAIFPVRVADLDLFRAQLVIRRRDGVEEKFSGADRGWERTGPEHQITKAYYSRYLPISREEMERLIS